MALLGCLFAACGGASDTARCVPGMSVACDCSGRSVGVQVCTDDGTPGVCECGDLGTPDAPDSARPADAALGDGAIAARDAGPANPVDASHVTQDAGSMNPVDVAQSPEDVMVNPDPPDTGTSCNATLVINEVQWTGPDGAGDEFVEIYNAGACDASLAGFQLAYRSAAGTTDTPLWTGATDDSVSPSGVFLLGGPAFVGARDGVIQGATTGALGRSGGIALYAPDGAIVDSMGYGTATNAFVEGTPATAGTTNTWVGRFPDGNDSNDNAADFVQESEATPGRANAP